MLEMNKNCRGISAEYLLALPTSCTARTPLLNLATKQCQHQYSCCKQKPLLTVFALALLDLILIPHRLVAWLAVEPGSEAANTSIWKYIKHYSPPLWTDFVSGFCQLSMVTFQQSAEKCVIRNYLILGTFSGHYIVIKRGWGWICRAGGVSWTSGGGWQQDSKTQINQNQNSLLQPMRFVNRGIYMIPSICSEICWFSRYYNNNNNNNSSHAHQRTAASTVWICAGRSTNGGLQKAAACSCSRPGGYGELAATPVLQSSKLSSFLLIILRVAKL